MVDPRLLVVEKKSKPWIRTDQLLPLSRTIVARIDASRDRAGTGDGNASYGKDDGWSRTEASMGERK